MGSLSVAAVYFTVSDAYMVKGDTFRAARTIGKAMEVYQGLGDKSKVGNCYVTMATIEIKGKDFGKVADYAAKATAVATEIGDVKVGGAAADVLVDMAIAQGDTIAALNNAKAAAGVYHQGGDAKGEGNALVSLVRSC